MLGRDLAELYGVETRALNQAVLQNVNRFPDDLMFQLTGKKVKSSRSQNVILKRCGNIKYFPRSFTEHGILMLSSVLRSERAVLVKGVQKIKKRQDTESREIWKAIKLLQSTVSR